MASLLLPAVLLDFVWLFLVFLLPAIVAVYHRGYIAWTHFAVPAPCSIEHHDPLKLFLPKLIPKSAVKKKKRPHQMRSLTAKSRLAMFFSRQMKLAALC